MKKLYTFLLILSAFVSNAQTKKDYIYNYAKLAVAEMEVSRIPASITLAQGILESRYGTSELSSKSNNHFGIKCHKGWQGESVRYDDDAKDECFRKYLTPAESFRDHSHFLSRRGRYSDLFKLSIYDYKGWAKGLRKAGYATNPRYADHLIKLIEEEELYVFDRMTSYEVEPYIASLRVKSNPNEIFVVKVEETPTVMPHTKPQQMVSVAEKPVKVIAVQGGPASTAEEPKKIVKTRDIFIENDIEAVFSYAGDSPQAISSMYDIPMKRLYKYNEWPQYLNEFTWGMKIYLQPKRSKSRDIAQLYHKVAPGETMYQIAQHYGIKTEKLYERNLLSESKNEQPRAGEMISLRKQVRVRPALRLASDKVLSADQMPQQEQDDAVRSHDYNSPKMVQKTTPKAEPKQIVVTQPAPKVVKTEPRVIETPPSQPQPSQAPVPQKSDDPWATYPSTKVAEPVPTPQTQPTVSEQTAGRSIIYEPTPAVNQQPVRAYEPPRQTRPVNTSTTTKSQEQPVAKTKYHKVVKGDTLYGLSKKYGVSVSQIKQWNNMNSNTIKLGQRLLVGKS